MSNGEYLPKDKESGQSQQPGKGDFLGGSVVAVGGRGIDMVKGVRGQEIQAALVIANRRPRDEAMSLVRVMRACERASLAARASYAYNRGGTAISGATIDLMEEIARCWGNIQTGVVELERRDGESTMMAYAWDLETNFHDSKTFSVAHTRSSGGNVVELTDERDIYESVANFAARRKRACLEAVIPRDIIELAREKCDETLRKGEKDPLVDRLRKMAVAFAEVGVTTEMLEGRMRHKLEATTEGEFQVLRKIYKSLKDGMSGKETWFSAAAPGVAERGEAGAQAEAAAPAAGKRGRPKKQAEETVQTAAPEPAKTQPVEVKMVAPMPGEEPQKDAAEDVQSSPEEETQAQEPPMPEIDRGKAFEAIKKLLTHYQVPEGVLMEYARGVMLARKTHKEVGEMSEANLLRIIDSWALILPTLRAHQKGKA